MAGARPRIAIRRSVSGEAQSENKLGVIGPARTGASEGAGALRLLAASWRIRALYDYGRVSQRRHRCDRHQARWKNCCHHRMACMGRCGGRGPYYDGRAGSISLPGSRHRGKHGRISADRHASDRYRGADGLVFPTTKTSLSPPHCHTISGQTADRGPPAAQRAASLRQSSSPLPIPLSQPCPRFRACRRPRSRSGGRSRARARA